jgi:DNA polymerase
MPVLVRDYETRSLLNLRDVGAWRYASHASTDVWCCAYAVDDGPIELWIPDDPIPAAFLDAAGNLNWLVAAFNDAFERLIEQHIMAPRFSWPLTPIERHRCLQAATSARALPGSLDGAAAALKLEQQKDIAGRRLMLQMSRPRKPRKSEDPSAVLWFDDPERRQRLYAYCRQDVATERELLKHVPFLEGNEQALWLLDQYINDRGVHIDRQLLEAALKIAEQGRAEIDLELAKITAGEIDSVDQVKRLLEWLNAHGVKLKNINKESLEKALTRELPNTTRRVIQLRLDGAHAAANKLDTMRAWLDGDDRARGTLKFHGASTGRWSSHGIQLQNLKRPVVDDIDQAIAAVASGSLERVRKDYPQPMSVVGDVARALICAAPGHRLIAADLSGIESRVIAWVSGQKSKLAMWARFDQTGDPKDEPYYLIGRMMSVPEEKARTTGKIADLAFGYQGGVGAWRRLAPDDPASDEQIKELQRRWHDAHPRTKEFWKAINSKAITAVRFPHRRVGFQRPEWRHLSFESNGSFLFMHLPSGRKIAYPFPSLRTDNERGNASVVFMDTSLRGWSECRNGLGAYGGLWTENVVSGIARDILAEGMQRLEAAGYKIVLHVHDEIVAEALDGFGSVEKFVGILTTPPAWAEGLPLAAKGRNGPRFAETSKPESASPEPPPWGHPARPEPPPKPEPEPQPEPPPHTKGGSSTRWQDYNFSGYQHGEKGSGRSTAHYIYQDAAGEPIRRVTRTADKQFPQARWDKASRRWISGVKGVPHYPYRLRQLNAADPAELVFVPEGEKDAENVAALGLIATTNDGGAGKWMPELNRWFTGRRVVLLADNDEPGRMHVAKVATMLAGIAAEIVTVHFLELPAEGDVSDWLEQGYGKAELLERVEAAKANPSATDRLVRVSASTVEMTAVDWFWPNRLARGKINLLGGLPDQGKGQLAAFLAAAATGNIPFPFGEGYAPQGNVIWFNAEDDRSDTVVPRLKAAGADLSKVTFVTSARVDGQDRTFNLQSDLPLLRDTIREVGNTVLIILDPVGSYLGVGKVNPWRGNDVRAVLAPLKELMEELHTTAFGIVHFNKKDEVKSALLRIADSIAFTAVPRSVYAALTDPEDPKARLFLRVKNNVAEQDVPGLRYAFDVKTVGFDAAKNKEIRAPRVVWLSRAEMSANDAMAAAAGESGYAKREAREFLETMLTDRPVLADNIIEAAKQNGISKRTLDRAKKDLKIRSEKTPNGWVWILPNKKAKDDQDCQGGPWWQSWPWGVCLGSSSTAMARSAVRRVDKPEKVSLSNAAWPS